MSVREPTGDTIRLTDVLGRPVLAGGVRIGKLADLAVDLTAPHPPLAGLVVRRPGRSLEHYPWRDVTASDALASFTISAGAPTGVAPPAHTLLLRQDVLDGQIVDLRGKRVVRVGDVVLALRGDAPLLVAVEVGAAAVLRRLGLGRLARRARSEDLDWSDLHPTSGRAHALHLSASASAVHRLSASELASLVERLPTPRAREVIQAVGPERGEQARARLEARPRPPRPRRFRNVLRTRRHAPS